MRPTSSCWERRAAASTAPSPARRSSPSTWPTAPSGGGSPRHDRGGGRTDDDFGASPQLFRLGDGTLIAGIGGKDGWYYAIDAVAGPGPAGRPRWATQVGQPGHVTRDFAVGGIIGSPAVGEVAGRKAVFVTTAISTPVGAPLGTATPAESLDPSVADDPGRLMSLHALDAATGRVLWRQPLVRQTYAHPTFANGVVFVPSTAGFSVQAFDADTGLPLWASPLNGPPSSGVAVTADGIYLGTGTRQTDAGFKLSRQTGLSTGLEDYLGDDPQERLAGVWAFRTTP